MSDMDDELRGLFQMKAGDVPPRRAVPRSLARRARRRVALNAFVLATTVVVVGAAGFVGVRALGTSGPGKSNLPAATTSPKASPRPATSPSPYRSASPSPSTSASPSILACTPGQLRAVGSMQGAAGSLEGAITLTNFSDEPCTLSGRPVVHLLTQDMRPIRSGVSFDSSPPGWKANGDASPPGWPVVTVEPGGAASVRIRWSNWCPQDRTPPLWRLKVSHRGAVNVTNGMEAAPPCNGPGQPATVEVGPFEPGAAS